MFYSVVKKQKARAKRQRAS